MRDSSGQIEEVDGVTKNTDYISIQLKVMKSECKIDFQKLSRWTPLELLETFNIPVNDDLTPDAPKVLALIEKRAISYAKELIEDAHSKLTEMEDKPASGHALQNNIAFQDKE